jgi:hypothetical protein
LLAELSIDMEDGRTISLGTDEAWKVRPAVQWERNLPRMSIQLGFPEVYDANREVTGWTAPGFDDDAWEPATVIGHAGMDPWPRLVPREIPAMMKVPFGARAVIDSGLVGGVRLGHSVDLLRVVWSPSNAVAYLATFVWAPAPADAEIHAGSQDAIRLWLNTEEVISHLVARDPAPDQESARVRLNAGWNAILAKIVQGEGQWHFYFRFDGEGSEHLVYSSRRDIHPPETEIAGPWRMVAPFPAGNLEQGFLTEYGPEQDHELRHGYAGKDGRELVWISAGVTKESMLTSVVMGREPRYPRGGEGFENIGGLITPGRPATVSPYAGHGRYAVIDFGMEVTGYPVVEISGALGGEIIDMGYGEVLETPAGIAVPPATPSGAIVNPERAAVHNADRYICKPGDQRFQTFDKRAFRYLQLDVRNLQRPIAVGPVSLVFSSYPVDYQGSFECSDPLLNRIWEVGRWTAQLNMEDAYSDSPWRERGQWWGDVRVEAIVSYYTFGDPSLVRQGLRHIAQSQTPEGLTMGVYPTGWPDGILSTYTLLWVVSLRDYALHTGDLDLVRELLPAVERAMEYFVPFLSEHGLLRDVPHWLFVDWAPVETKGESTAVNALYHEALRAFAQMEDYLGDRGKRETYDLAAGRLREGMLGHLWDPGAGCFRDSVTAGRQSRAVSEQANCWAIVFGVAPPQSRCRILPSLLEEGRADVRIATPYFAFYLLQALARAGLHEHALSYIREKWGAMLDWGATTWWETWEPKASFCHGWSAGPTGFLPSDILGLKPARPGWEEILVEPHPAGLQWARGGVPTPGGKVSMEWTAAEEFTLVVDLPSRAHVRIPEPWLRGVLVTRENGHPAGGVEYLPDSAAPRELKLAEAGSYRIKCRR